MVDHGTLRRRGRRTRTRLSILIFLLLPVLFLLLFGKREESVPVYVVYTAVLETDESTARALCVGDTLTDARAKGEAGEILRVSREAALREDAEGVYVHPTRVKLAITLGAEGKRTERGVSIAGWTPRVGEAVYLYGTARIEGLCVRVRAI